MGLAAAIDTAEAIRRFLAVQGAVRMVFAAAPSQAEALAALVRQPDVDWRRVTAFPMDEYLGLAPGAPQSFAGWLDLHLFSHAPFAAVHRLVPGGAPEEAARHYARLLDEAPIDIVCLGIGVNGHIAFNDPPVADFNDPHDVKIVELDEICRRQQVDDGCFVRFDQVPTHALTLTIPRLLRAGQMICVVPGPLKRAAVAATLHGPVTTACPASILRQHPACTLYIDREADPDA
ncbi:MAG: glucosamine-6-phosphate deaminase [Hyphomicrobiales bacterium]|nr:glucosamine-6-phosphate deaminase [Hyphomicrobiales bacterium]